MIDFYKFSILSALGKDAGKSSMSEYLRDIEGSYDRALGQIRAMKAKRLPSKQDMELYL